MSNQNTIHERGAVVSALTMGASRILYNLNEDIDTMTRKPLIAANWKMYKTPAQAQEFVKNFLPLVTNHERDEIVLCPSFTSLSVVIAAVTGLGVAVGAQNMHFADEGAYTGETSPLMLKAIGATHVILGHSERRQYFCETDEVINKKLKTAVKHRLVPIVCVGEVLAEREGGKTEEVLVRQTRGVLAEFTAESAASVVIAYEPVWAIGTGKTATPAMASEAHKVIRGEVAQLLGNATAERMRILYGGSVKPDNATALMSEAEIDGALVGGASLDPQSFGKIVKY
jgi:triosephosphate isomerase